MKILQSLRKNREKDEIVKKAWKTNERGWAGTSMMGGCLESTVLTVWSG